MRYRHRNSPGRKVKFVSSSWDGTPSETWFDPPPESSETTQDEVIPNYKKRSAAGEIFNNPFSSHKARFMVSGTRSENFRDIPKPWVHFNGTWSDGAALLQMHQTGELAFPSVTSFSDEDLRRKAEIQVLGAVNKTDFDLGTFLGEWEKSRVIHRDLGNALVKLATEYNKDPFKTSAVKRINVYDGMGNPVLKKDGKPLTKAYHTVKQGKGRKRVYSTNAANLYLLARFGILPLLHDLESALKLLLKTTHRRETARGYSDFEGKATAVKQVLAFPDCVYNIDLVTSRAVKYRYGILYETDVASTLAGNLGLTRPLSTLWELTPYSFVIDRFVQIGQWLNAVQPSGVVKTLSAWVSRTETITESATINQTLSGSAYGGNWDGSWSGALVHTSVSKTRVPWEIVIPKRPTNFVEFSNIHVLDYVTLVLQKVSTRSK